MTALTFKNVILLQKCPVPTISTFLHSAIDSIQHNVSGPVYGGQFAEIWDLEEWWQIVHVFQSLARTAVNKDWDADQITSHLEGLAPELRQEVQIAISARKADIRQALQNNTCAISNAALSDFDWQVKLAVASDKLATVKAPVVSIDLDIKEDNGLRNVSIEVNRDDLKRLLSSLEAASKALSQLRS